MAIYFNGIEYSKAYVRGIEVSGIAVGGEAYLSSDTSLSLTVTQASRGYDFAFSVTDPDGIRSISAATVTASDGTQASALEDFARTNANTFAGTDNRRNARWASGTMSVTYVDATSGASVTVTGTWSV